MRKIFVLLVLLMLVFCLPTMAEDVTPTLGDDSAYTLTEVDSSTGDNVISRPYYNKETGELSVKYYCVDLRKTEYGEGGNSQTVNVKVIDTEVPVTVKYNNSTTKTYTNVYSSAITNMSTITIDNAIFENVNSTSTLVYNKNKGKITSLICDFISNSVTITSSLGGGGIVGNYAFANSAATTTATIGDITGDFVNNTVTVKGSLFGGGIVGIRAYTYDSSTTATATIGDITGDFLNNTVTVTGNISLWGGGIVGIYASAGNYATATTTIGDITGDFVKNTVTVSGSNFSSLYGGGIVGIRAYTYDSSTTATATIGDITGDFVNNAVTVTSSLYGGGIVGIYAYANNSATTTATIGDITGDFLNNTVTVTVNSSLYGGGIVGIYPYANNSATTTATIGDITGDFLNNTVTVNSRLYGGGIVGIYADASRSATTTARIGDITGDFVNNTVTVNSSLYGGGIVGIYAYANSSSATATIGDITGDFVNNAVNVGGLSGGGIVGNYAYTYSSATSTATIGNITGNFVNNKITVGYSFYGGVIGNYSKNTNSYANIGQINSNFYNNSVVSTNTGSNSYFIYGGAISNSGVNSTIQGISGDFVENGIETKSTGSDTKSLGGAIYNSGKITNGITNSSFIGNYAKSTVTAQGGAIYTTTNLSINADNGTTLFSGNYTQVGTGEKDYNAIYVGSSYATLKLNAVNNGVIQLNDNINGASGYDVKITGDSTGVVKLYNDIKNADVITDNVTVDTANGQIHNYNFKTLTSNATTKYSIDIDLTNKTSDKFTVGSASSGTITIDGLNILSGSFESITDKTFKVQILNSQNNNIQLNLSDTIKSQLPDINYEIGRTTAIIKDDVQQDTKWTDIYKQYTQDTVAYGKLGLATTNTTNDSIGIVYDHSETEDKVVDKKLDTLAHVNQATLDNKNFIFDSSDDVYKVTEDLGETAQGKLNINGVLSKAETTDPNTNEVTVTQNTSTIDFDNKSGFELNNATVLNINNTTLTNAKGTNGAVISANNQGAEINLNNTSLVKNVSSGNGGAIYSKANVNINANNAVVSISNNSDSTGNVAIYMDNADKTLTLNSTNNGVIKLDDKINGATGYKVNITGDGTGTFYMYNDMNNANVSMGNVNLGVTNNIVHNYDFNSFNLTGNVKMIPDVDLVNKQMDRITANTYYVSEGATLTVTKLNLMNSTTAEKISIKFAESNLANSVRYTGSNNVIKSPIYNYVTNYKVDENGVGYFNFVRGSSSDSSSYNPSVLATSTAQQTGTYTTQLNTFNYAFQHAETFMNLPAIERIAYKNRNKYALSNVGVFSPLMTGSEDTGFWIKPYATFENVPLKNGPKVNSISYGTLVGYDELMVSLKHGWDRVFTYYLGYNGASQNYSGVDCYQNGGLLGATMTLYKGNFFTATTLSAGATVGEAHTMYGTEYSTTMFAGIGNKIGYNIELNQGKFIIQPSMLLAYTFLNTFDYKNAAGVQINSDPTSMIQIAPTVRFVVNTKTGWQPYLAVGMVWNILAHSNIKANNEELPDMYTKPYVQYGLGVQRVIKDRFTAFGQAMIYNGGRNGVSLTAGVRYALGKDGHKHTSGTPKVVKEAQPKAVANSDTAQTTGDKKVTSPKGVKKVKSNKNDKKITKQKLFDFKLQQPSISIVK